MLSRTYKSTENGDVREIIIADTFSNYRSNGFTRVFMTNAFVFQTTTPKPSASQSTNKVEQLNYEIGVLGMRYPDGTRVLYQNSLKDLSLLDLAAFKGTNKYGIVHEGKAALEELKKMGLQPPEDMDLDKALAP